MIMNPRWYTKLVLTTGWLLASPPWDLRFNIHKSLNHSPPLRVVEIERDRKRERESLHWGINWSDSSKMWAAKKIHKTLSFFFPFSPDTHACMPLPEELSSSWGKCALDSPNVTYDFLTQWAKYITALQTSRMQITRGVACCPDNAEIWQDLQAIQPLSQRWTSQVSRGHSLL